MAGRKPLPTAIKKLKGTLQKCRINPHEPQPAGDLVDPPEYMAEGAQQAWRYAITNSPPGLSSALDGAVLERWANCSGLYREALALINWPEWLFLDEANAALPEQAQADLYALLREKLPQTTLVSIGHRDSLAQFH